MRVVLAGYNVDARMLDTAVEAGVPRERLTPEVLSAAYARISRDPRPVSELRKVALEEVEKARSSNRKIIFEMGHHSVAEHAVFNFDVIGISRLAIEWLERFRLCSYTEKSQRYITLDHDFVIPPELRDTPEEGDILSMISAQSKIYERFNRILRERLAELHPQKTKKKAGRRLLDGMAKEDARYVTVLATTGQLGLTANARNLEHIVRRFASAPLAEVRELGQQLYEAAAAVAPSLLLFTERSKHDAETPNDLAILARELMPVDAAGADESEPVRLVYHKPDGDRTVTAALMHAATTDSFERCQKTAAALSGQDLERVFHTALKNMEFYDAPPREFEHVTLTFELALSSSAYAQLKRHRMTSQSVQSYDPRLGVTVPPTIVEAGLRDEFMEHMARTEQLYFKLLDSAPAAAPYALTNAHRRRVLVTTNLRELYHFIRLREDAHAQWDIRKLAEEMHIQVAEVMPLSSLTLCGKHTYPEVFEKVFGHPPALLPPQG